ncbi:MAG: nucleotidyltransferase domain-containing protein [Actinobacteria bacterium]|jgi:predicted nucleotidyltransferase|nr:MAG: nucleotidyltransferase domain-containing protein [Actinomycetota bacterium]
MRINSPLDDIFHNKNNVRILRHLVLFPSKVITGRGIARELGMNHATCIRALDSLVDMGAISRKTVGKSSIYEIPDDTVLYKDLLRPLFEKEASLLEDLVRTLSKGIKQRILSVYVFGSVARGEDTPASDIDLVLILKAGANKEKVEEVIAENEREAYKLYRIGTNTLLYTSDEFERLKQIEHPLAREILSEGKLLYGKEQ